MAYRDSLPPTSNISAVFSASLEAALIGSTIVAFVTALEFGLSLGGGVLDQLSWVVFVFIIFIICLPVGIIAIISLLTIFGLPIAYLARDTLATTTGSAIAMVSAIAISALVAVLLGGVEVIIFVLPFSIPAAILFRREILLDRTLP